MQHPSPDADAVGIRIRAILRKRGWSIDQGAMMLGLARSAFQNYLGGWSVPKHGQGLALVKLLPGLTLEWLYWGDDRLVPAGLARELAIFEEAIRQGLELPVAAEDPEELLKALQAGKRLAERATG